MALVFDTNTATSPVTGTRTLNPAPINFEADWRISRESPNELVLTNVIAPLNNPETIRIAYTEVKDVFKGSSIEPPSDSASGTTANAKRRGCSLLVQLNGVIVDTFNDAPYPYSAHLVLKVPFAPEPDVSNLATVVDRLLGSLYSTKATTWDGRMSGLLRGALAPTDL